MTVRILHGDCRELMAAMPERSVHACVTSPPYWGLRDYGTPPLSWPAFAYAPLSGLPACVEIPAMECSLGLEPTLEAFIGHMVLVFREVRRVLRDDGSCWVNMGDSYAGSRCGGEQLGTLAGKQPTHSKTAKKNHQAFTSDQRNASSGAKRAMTASRRRDDEPIPRSDLKIQGLKPKDLVGQPWRLAFALQADGWWLRSDVIWDKPNPMPESTKDRPTKAHEYLFLLAKSERYYFDQDAIKEPASADTHARYARGRSQSHKWSDEADPMPGQRQQTIAKSFEHMRKPVGGWANGPGTHTAIDHTTAAAERGQLLEPRYPGNGVGWGHGSEPKPRTKGRKLAEAGSGTKNNESFDAAMAVIPESRNKRSVWRVVTEGFPEAHFATFPTALIRPCIQASTSEKGACPDCGAPWNRLVKIDYTNPGNRTTNGARSVENREITAGFKQRLEKQVETLGWEQGCECAPAEPVPCTVLDQFGGSGTTGLVADRLQRNAILCELNPKYIGIAERRITADSPLFTDLEAA